MLPAQFDLEDAFSFNLGQPILVQPDRIFRLGPNRLQVNLEDILDISGLSDTVIAIVNQGIRDRSVDLPSSTAGSTTRSDF
jgi:hypothetical protein